MGTTAKPFAPRRPDSSWVCAHPAYAVIVGRQARGGKAWLFPEGWDGKRVPLELNSGFSLVSHLSVSDNNP